MNETEAPAAIDETVDAPEPRQVPGQPPYAAGLSVPM